MARRIITSSCYRPRMLQAFCALVLAITMLVMFVSPAAAIADPDSIEIKSIGAFTNIREEGDILFVMSYDIVYGNITGLNSASDYFAFTIYNEADTVMIGFYPAIDYQYKLTSIYYSAAAVSDPANGLVVGAKYKVRIGGTPTAFPGGTTEDVNMDTRTMAISDWYINTQVNSRESLRLRILSIMTAIQAHDGNCTYLLQATESTQILSATTQSLVDGSGYAWSGKSMVLTAIPHLDNVMPDMFESATQNFTIWTPEGTGALQAEATMASRLGMAFTNAFAGIGDYFGVSTQWAGAIFWSIIMAIAAMIIFAYSGNSLAAMILVLPLLLMGNWLGIIPIVITFVLTILLVIYMGYHIYLRGMV